MPKDLIEINEITLHYKRPHIYDLPMIKSIAHAVEILRTVIDKNQIDLREHFWVLLLTGSDELLGISQVSLGTVIETRLNAREILQLALKSNAVKVLLAHNHTSGDPRPSQVDIHTTRKFMEIAEYMDIHLMDHVILTSESYTSMLGSDLLS